MGDIDRIQQINSVLQSAAAPLRVADGKERRQQREEQKKKREDQVELTNELEEVVGLDHTSSPPQGEGLDLAI